MSARKMMLMTRYIRAAYDLIVPPSNMIRRVDIAWRVSRHVSSA